MRPLARLASRLTAAALLSIAPAASRAQVSAAAIAEADSLVLEPLPADDAPDEALRRAAALDAGEYEIERLRFLAWLGDSVATLDAAAKERAAEHLHYLVTSAARLRVDAGVPSWPAVGDADLATLLAWRARLGSIGSGLAARGLGAENPLDGAEVPVLLPAPPLHLTLEGGAWRVRSSGAGWSLAAPWYFGIEHARTSRAANGVVTEKLVLATPFGPHADASGESRGSILVVAARTRDRRSFQDFWARSLGAADRGGTTSTELPGATTWMVRDARWRTVTEIVALDLPSGAMVLAFAAADGAFESQRPAFTALLRSLGKTR